MQQFEEDALAWEDKLNRINALFDVWIDVQRRWVYLEGIFTGSADINTIVDKIVSAGKGVALHAGDAALAIMSDDKRRLFGTCILAKRGAGQKT